MSTPTTEAIKFAVGPMSDQEARLNRALNHLQREIDGVRRELQRKSVFENLNIVNAAATVARETAKYALVAEVLDAAGRIESAEVKS